LRGYGLDAIILHTPGHTPGSSTLLLGDGTAFASDLLGSVSQPHLQSSSPPIGSNCPPA